MVIVSDPEQVQAAISKVVQDFGKIDVFVANAGKSSLTHLHRVPANSSRHGDFKANFGANPFGV